MSRPDSPKAAYYMDMYMYIIYICTCMYCVNLDTHLY